MSAGNPKSGKAPELFHISRVTFLGEQDGPAERELESRLIELLRSELRISRAYLARVNYSDPAGDSVALCVRCAPPPCSQIVERVGKIFASIFGAHEHLDVLFLEQNQEAELAKRCRPFFVFDGCSPRPN
jgi:hypothetical protein